jgi:transcriptional regulator with XRE-family HTH domain
MTRPRSDSGRRQILIQQLKAARRSSGLTQQELAARLGIDPQAVGRMERGVGSVGTLVRAMRVLDFRLAGVGRGSTLPEQLRANRLGRSLSLREASVRAGMSRTTLAGIERGDGTIASLLRLVAALAPRARRRAQERVYWGEGDKRDRDSRFTPADFMSHIHAAFGEVDLDPCGHRLSPVVARRRILLDEGGDGLVEDWSARLVFVNPPFSELTRWLERAHGEWRVGRAGTVVCLVPVRTDSALFHDRLSSDADIYLLRGRVRFLDPQGKAQPTPFSLMLMTFGSDPIQRNTLAASLPGLWLTRKEDHGRGRSGYPGGDNADAT